MPKLSFLSARAFDSGLAALAALSAGFVAFAMPQPLFSGLVEASRLPDFVAAAQPPLGDTARFAAVGAAALLTFVAVWVLMAALGRAPAGPGTAAEAQAEAPRLRRADAHPDAPARPPLLARDLGEPLDLQDFPEAPADESPVPAEAEQRPLPAFLVPQAPEAAPAAEAEPEPWTEPEPEPEPEPLWTPSAPSRAVAEPAPEPAPQAGPLPISELAAQLPEAEEDPDQPLSQLVNRIEFGLSRKRQALPAADLPPVEEAACEQDKIGHRLRSAINDLQKIASSGG
ncbi:MAG: hypothetical protein ABWX67_16310 [Allosphingosinicella sp.]